MRTTSRLSPSPTRSAFPHMLGWLALLMLVVACLRPATAHAQSTVTAFTATDGTFENRVALAWTATTNAGDQFRIERDGTVLAVRARTETAYQDPTGDPGTVYNYCLILTNGGADLETTCVDGSRIVFKPTGLEATDGTRDTDVQLTWTDRSLIETAYEVHRAEGFAVALDGSGIVDVPGTEGSYNFVHETGVFTVEALVYFDQPGLSLIQTILGNSDGPGVQGFSFALRSGGGLERALTLTVFDNTGGSVTFRSKDRVVPGTPGWHHVVAVGDGATVIFYVDGVAYPNQNVGGFLPAAGDAGRHFGLGAAPTNGGGSTLNLFGGLSDVRVWNDARTPQEISANAFNRLAGTEADLAAYWPLVEDIGDPNDFVAANNGTLAGGATWDTALPPPIDMTVLDATLAANTGFYQDATAVVGTPYTYCVRAAAAAGLPSAFACDAGRRGAILPPLNVSATDGQLTDRVRITWTDQADGEDGYIIYRVGAPPVTVPADSEFYEDVIAPVPDVEYNYCVATVIGGSESIQVCDLGRPGDLTGPSNVVASDDLFDDRVDVTWSDDANTEDGFEVWRRDLTQPDTVLVATTRPDVERYSDRNAAPAVDYEYCVRAFSELDPANPSFSFKTCDNGSRNPVLPPTNVAATDADFEDRVRLTWTDASTTAMLFNIYRDGTLIDNVPPQLTLFDVTGIPSDVEENYCVTAVTVVNPTATTALEAEVTSLLERATSPRQVMAELALLSGSSGGAGIHESDQVCDPGSRSLNAPTSVTASYDEFETHVQVTWVDQSSVERGYLIYRQANTTGASIVRIGSVSASRGSYGDYTGEPGVEYTYSVTAVDDHGESTAGEDVGFRQLEPPTLLAASDGTSETEVKLTWKDNSRAMTDYEIYRGGVLIHTIDDANATSYTDVPPVEDVDVVHTYSVRAIDNYGASSEATDQGGTTLQQPGDVNASDLYPDKVVITWTDRSGIDGGFEVYRTNTTSGSGSIIGTTAPNETSFEDLGAADGVVYEYCVRTLPPVGVAPPAVGTECDEGGKPDADNPAPSPSDVLTDVLEASDGDQSDRFGNAVSISGDYAIVGAFTKDGINNDVEGVAYIFRRTGTTWQEHQKLVAADGGQLDRFGVSVSISGDYAIVGASGHDIAPNTSVGAAYIYKRNGATWQLQQKIVASDGAQSDQFGTSVSIDGDYAIIGSPFHASDPFISNQGAAYVFKRAGSSWQQQQKIVASDGAASDIFGRSVSISGDRVIVGADGVNGSTGAAYVFKRTGATWEPQQKIVASDGAPNDQFGGAVSISSDNALVGAFGDNSSTGAAYLFTYNGATWQEQQKLTDSNGAANDSFGIAVAIRGIFALVGAMFSDEVGDNSGAAYLYRGNGTQWRNVENLLPGGAEGNATALDAENFGRAVAIDENDILVGATGAFGQKIGAAYLHKIILPPSAVLASDGAFADRVQVNWQDTGLHEDGFNVYRRDTRGNLEPIASTGPNVETYNDFSAEPGGSYEYCIAAFNNDLLEGATPSGDGLLAGESNVACDTGWRPPDGSISGRVAALGGGGTEEVAVCLDPSPNRSLLLDGALGHARIDDVSFPGDALHAFTVAFWMKSSASEASAPFSYATSEKGDNTLLIINPGNFDFYINGSSVSASNTIANDGQWHHIAVTWQSSDDSLHFYKDGQLALSTTVETGAIPAGGVLIFGQDQDAVGGGFQETQAFTGLLDDVQIWNVVRSQEQIQAAMQMPLSGNEQGLVAYWPFDEGTREVAADLTGGGQNAHLMGGAYWAAQGAPLNVCATTDVEGNYNLSGLRYGPEPYTVTPSLGDRTFDPAFKTIALSTQSPVQNQVDFVDETAFTVSGVVTFEGTTCPVPDVEIYAGPVGDEVFKGSTESDGTYIVSVDPSNLNADGQEDLRRIEPRLDSEPQEIHTFAPAFTDLVVTDDVAGINFEDQKTRALSGFFGGSCGIDIGSAKLRIYTENGCYEQEINVSGAFDIDLPPQAYLVEVKEIIGAPADLRNDILAFFDGLGTQEANLTEATDTLDLTYHAPLAITIDGLVDKTPTCPAGFIAQEDAEGVVLRELPVVPVIGALETVDLTISVVEDYGNGNVCPVEEGQISVFDGIADREPQVIEFKDGQVFYTTEGASPNTFVGAQVGGVDRSLQKPFTVAAKVAGRAPVTETQWALVEGTRDRSGTFVSGATDPIPMMMLHDPPGSNSYAYIEEGTTTCERFSSMAVVGGGGGLEVDIAFGPKVGVGIGVVNDVGAGILTRGRAFVGTETALMSAGACFNALGLIPILGSALLPPGIALTAPALLPVLANECEDTDGQEKQNKNIEVCMTTTKRHSTSSDMGWVGEDIFMGVAYNLLFAEADELEATDDQCTVALKETVEVSLDPNDAFRTTYVYGSTHLEHSLIPALEELQKLEDEPTFPDETGSQLSLQDAIDNWRAHLAAADELVAMGVEGTCATIENGEVVEKPCEEIEGLIPFEEDNFLPFAKENISFSAGAEYEESASLEANKTTYARSTRLHVSTEGGLGGIFTQGYDNTFQVLFAFQKEFLEEQENTEAPGKSVGYVLSDGDTGDFYSVNVGTNSVFKTPVFEIRSGRSSNPWEENTQRRDSALIAIDPPVLYDVDPEGAGSFQVTLTNASPSQERREYVLAVPGETNPKNLGLTVTGDLLGGQRLETFLLEPGESKTIHMDAFPAPSAYEYEDVALILYPEVERQIWLGDPRQDFAMADTAWFSIYFKAPCSPIAIQRPLENWALNAGTFGAGLTVDLFDFEIPVSESDAVEQIGLEYRRQGTSTWLPAVDIFVNQAGPVEADSLGADATSWNAVWNPGAGIAEGGYDLRAFTSCPVGGKVYSEVVPGLIDMTAPSVFGTPEPADQILTLGADIAVTFDEAVDCSSVRTDSTTSVDANAKLVYLDGPDANSMIPGVEATCNGETLILSPPDTFDWAAAEGRLIEARLLTNVLDGTGNPVVLTDLAGNPIAEAVSWPFTVRRAGFAWSPVNVEADITRGTAFLVETALVNGRAQPADFTLPATLDLTPEGGGDVIELTPSITNGTIVPGGTQAVTLAIPDTLDLGTYTAELRATRMEGGVAQEEIPFYLTANVVCRPPSDWRVDPAGFQFSMTLTARLYINGVESLDPADRVVALVGNQVRGAANVEEVATGVFRVQMLIHSSDASGEAVTFQVWDDDDCTRYDETSLALSFQDGAVHGTVEQPVTLEAPLTLEPDEIPLAAGWTWFSLNKTPTDTDVNAVLTDVAGTPGDLVKSQTQFSLFDESFGWVGTLGTLEPGPGYQIKLQQSSVLMQAGTPVDVTSTPVTINTGWNWIGYLPQHATTVDDALADFAAEPDDVIKSQSAFAQFFDDGVTQAWVGSLTQMAPGKGYQLKTSGPGGDFNYPDVPPPTTAPAKTASTVAALKTGKAQARQASLTQSPDWQVNAGAYLNNMTLTVRAMLDGRPLGADGSLVGVFDGETCRGVARVQAVPGVADPLAFLMVHSDASAGETLSVRLYDAATDSVYAVTGILTFVADASAGTIAEPLLFEAGATATSTEAGAELPEVFALEQNYPNPFNPQTTIRYGLPQAASVRLVVYDVLGREVVRLVEEEQTAGWHEAQFDARGLASGMYLYRLEAGAYSEVRRMILLQ